MMLGLGWFAARQAQQALKAGRLDEVQRLLDEPGGIGPKRLDVLKKDLARAYVERGQKYLTDGDRAAAWEDLASAERVGSSAGLVPLRDDLVQAELGQMRSLLEAGKPARALELAELLRERDVDDSELDRLAQAARDWVRAGELADRGEFGQACVIVETLQRLFPGVAAAATLLTQLLDSLHRRQESLGEALNRLVELAPLGRWGEVLQWCDRVLAAAPEHPEARRLRQQAWRVLEPATVVSRPALREVAADATLRPSDPRYLLWIDGVGGYLVCLGSRVTFGQASPDAQVDVPVFADLSKHQATLTRDAEGYLLEAVRSVLVNGKPATRTLLQDGDRVTLGSSCQFVFRIPVPVSATARLDLVSGHRLKLAVDAILLMADSLVLGPGVQSHVSIPDLQEQVVLYRHKDGLGVRAPGKLVVNGRPGDEHAVIGWETTVQGEDFSFAVEPAGTVLV